jgi:hypothetical protein
MRVLLEKQYRERMLTFHEAAASLHIEVSSIHLSLKKNAGVYFV